MVAGSHQDLSLRLDRISLESLQDSAGDNPTKARLASLVLQHSGDWLYVAPCPALGLHMQGIEFRVASLYRLGMPVFRSDGPCVACSFRNSDRYGHQLWKSW